MDTITKDPENPIAWHSRLAQATKEWDSGDIPTIRKSVQEKVESWIAKAPPVLREVITVVIPFSKDYVRSRRFWEEKVIHSLEENFLPRNQGDVFY